MKEKPDQKLKKPMVQHNTGDELEEKQEWKLKKPKVSHNSRDEMEGKPERPKRPKVSHDSRDELEEKPERKQKKPKVDDEGIIGEQPDLKKCRAFVEPGPEAVENIETIGPAEVKPKNLPAAGFRVGSKCRFLYKDGFWYNGEIIEFLFRNVISVSFLNPTTQKRMICKSLLEHKGQRRFKCNCFEGHVEPYIPTEWNKSLVGTPVFAAVEPAPTIWKSAVLRSWDEELKLGEVVFDEDGTSAQLGADLLSLIPCAKRKNTNDSSDDNKDSDSDNIKSTATSFYI